MMPRPYSFHVPTNSATSASDVTGAYQWSADPMTWNASGASVGSTTVTFATPELVEIIASLAGIPVSKVSARHAATQNQMSGSDKETGRPVNAIVLPIVTALLFAFSIAARANDARPPGPNIVLILADDLGIECLSTYGGTSHQTPNIDRLAGEGMRFTHCFSNPLCSPSRGSLLTGRYPFQNGLKVVLHGKHQENIFLSTKQPCFPRQLKQRGYATQIVGKWHVSLEHRHNTIRAFGFDHYQTWTIFDQDGRKTTRFWEPYQMRDGRIIAGEIKGRYGPDVDLEVYLEFIKSNGRAKTPFLAFYSTCLPHYPWEPTPDSKDRSYRAPNSAHKGRPEHFPEMLAYLDKQIGAMLKTLDDLGIAENTIVSFLADNGTDSELVHTWGDGKRIAGGKGTMTDGGTRVPLMVRWPGKIKPGSTCGDLVDLTDFLPTICELAGAPLPPQSIHGRSFAPQLLGNPGNPREWIHIQNGNSRQIRNSEFMLNNRGELRRVVGPGDPPAEPDENREPQKEAAARKALQAAFDELGE
jgi:arylsulfatase A-like enzyme